MTRAEVIGLTKTIAVPLIMLLVLLRLCMLVLTEDADMFYFVRHGIYTVTWLAVAYFMFHCSMYMHRRSFAKEEIRYMKQIAFWAMIACVARIIVSTIYYWPIVTVEVWPSAHCVLELSVWAILALFFGSYWRIRAEQENEMDM